jgi:AraC-like DNA-binding protein
VHGVALFPHTFEASVASLDFGDFAVEIIRTSPALLIEASESGRAGCLLMLDGVKRAKWDGCAVDRFDVASLEPAMRLVGSFYDPFACAFISTEENAVEAFFGSSKQFASRRSGVRVQRATPTAHMRLSNCIGEAERIARYAPDVFHDDPSRIGLRASLIDAARSLFVPAGVSSPPRNRAVSRHRIVRLVDEHLCANPVRPIYTDDLCQALGVSASALREAFQDVFGISPHRYLKLRRMSLTRAALLSSSGPWRSVKAAALSHGFWHLGQFAQDYREIYGEVPSATLARGRPDVRG